MRKAQLERLPADPASLEKPGARYLAILEDWPDAYSALFEREAD